MECEIVPGRIRLKMDDVTTIVEHDDVVIFNLECESKRPHVELWECEDGCVVVWIEPGETSLYLDETTNECTRFVVRHGGDRMDWSIMAEAGKWAVTVVLWRRER